MSKYFIACVLFLITYTAQATPLRLDATTAFPAYTTDFSVIFNDTGDGILQIGEIFSFTGFNFLREDSNVPKAFYDEIYGIPTIPGISMDDRPIQPAWTFTAQETRDNPNILARGFGSGFWNYNITEITQVPEPSTYLLMGLGLIGLTYARRRKRF
jgi:hypothetical protein